MLNITINTKEGIKRQVNIRRTLSGDYILKEHPEIDIFIIPQKQKILVTPKDDQTEQIYTLQERLFKYMVDKGVVLPESVIAGNIYGSLQGGYPAEPPGGEDALQVVVYTLANFLSNEVPQHKIELDYEERMERELLQPSEANATDLGEVPQEPFKGSIPKYGFPTRGIYRYNY
jgi:hypothetical protein